MSGMVLEVQKLMPQPHHRQHSRFLQSSSMAMELGHGGYVAGELVGYTVVMDSWRRRHPCIWLLLHRYDLYMATFAQI